MKEPHLVWGLFIDARETRFSDVDFLKENMQVVGSCSDKERNKHKVFVSNKEADIVGRVRPDAVPPGTPRGVVGENCPMAVRTAGDPEQVIARVEVGPRNFSAR